jgi:hypothetical protein
VRNNVAQETKCSPKPSGKKERQKDRKKDRTRERDEATAATCECTLDNDRFVGENGSRARWQNRECEKRKMKKNVSVFNRGLEEKDAGLNEKEESELRGRQKWGEKLCNNFPYFVLFKRILSSSRKRL